MLWHLCLVVALCRLVHCWRDDIVSASRQHHSRCSTKSTPTHYVCRLDGTRWTRRGCPVGPCWTLWALWHRASRKFVIASCKFVHQNSEVHALAAKTDVAPISNAGAPVSPGAREPRRPSLYMASQVARRYSDAAGAKKNRTSGAMAPSPWSRKGTTHAILGTASATSVGSRGWPTHG